MMRITWYFPTPHVKMTDQCDMVMFVTNELKRADVVKEEGMERTGKRGAAAATAVQARGAPAKEPRIERARNMGASTLGAHAKGRR
jgi:hypothetical protein